MKRVVIYSLSIQQLVVVMPYWVSLAVFQCTEHDWIWNFMHPLSVIQRGTDRDRDETSEDGDESE
jgi:hypothetical protein